MPMYSYICTECATKFDKDVSLNERNDSQVCPNCGHDSGERRLTPPSVWSPTKGT